MKKREKWSYIETTLVRACLALYGTGEVTIYGAVKTLCFYLHNRTRCSIYSKFQRERASLQ